jgi:predicted RNase H-like nuclease
MTQTRDSGPAAPGTGAVNPWLAEIKAEATRRQAVRNVSALSEDELLDEAARGVAERRADRHDLIGALMWEEIAKGPRIPDATELPEPHADDSGTPMTEGTGRD